MILESVGKKIDEIPVEISYKIIDLFSAGLYSSPNKAFEELVSNSYDANASKVSVYVPLDKSIEDSILWVADNGTSMDKEGLKQFWKIGDSTKRVIENPNQNRLPIGKFGIGKLATFVLTRKLTIICKASNNIYYAVTMDYSTITPYSSGTIKLDERELTLEEVKSALNPLITKDGINFLSFNLWGESCEQTWTFAIMSQLKPKSSDIQDGRLKWILSTALPLNPDFQLFFNGSEIKSSKDAIEPMKSWIFGVDDETAKKHNYEVSTYHDKPCVHVPKLKNIVGQMDLYRDSLVKGKSENWGRSNGIFLMVRERLINIDDPLLGMESMSHGVFNRLRIIVHADELDTYITSTRESIKESGALEELQKYIKRKFSEAFEYYFKEQEEAEKRNRASYKIASASGSLSRRPLLVAAKKFLDGELMDLVLTDIPRITKKEEKEELIKRLEESLTSEEGIIKDVEWKPLRPEDPIAKLDLLTGVASINLMHPFFANFLEEIKSPLPFQLIALTEILTECFLIEDGIQQEEVRNIMWRRDSILRELTFSDKPNAPFVAQLLQATLGNSAGLEDSVGKAFATLGYETTPIGGPGKPDGIAVAYLGHIGSPDNHSITYDAKSTAKEKIKATTAHISGVDRHRDDYKANFACVIAIDFEGAEDKNSAVNKEAEKSKINLIRAKDLMTLVLISSPKQIGTLQLKNFFETCHKVTETSEWIRKAKDQEVDRGPIKELLETTYKIIKTDKEPPDLSALRHSNDVLKKYSVENLKSFVLSLERLVPRYITLNNNVVSLQAPPEKILKEISQIFTTDVPLEFRDIYLKAFKLD